MKKIIILVIITVLVSLYFLLRSGIFPVMFTPVNELSEEMVNTSNAPVMATPVDELTKEMDDQISSSFHLDANYSDYVPGFLAKAKDGKVVLFFKANWCPTCKALDADILSNMEKIPSNVFILKVDYDSAKALKLKYNVVTQHTLVQVDENGNELNKWVGGNTLESILDRVL